MRSKKRARLQVEEASRREFLGVGAMTVAAITKPAQPAQGQGTPNPDSRKTILAIGAHYDDCVFGIPGVLLQAVEKGHRVAILSLIGDYTNWEPARSRSGELVEGTRRVCGDFGMEARFLNFASGRIPGEQAGGASVAAVVAEVQPAVAFMLWPRDQHPDHEAAARLSHLALRLGAQLAPQPIASFRPPQRIFLYDNGPRHAVGFEPNTFVDVTSVWPGVIDWLGRVMALVGGGEQGRRRVQGALKAKETLARYRGSTCGVAYAEALVSADAYPQEIF